jgi:hypothetical protein
MSRSREASVAALFRAGGSVGQQLIIKFNMLYSEEPEAKFHSRAVAVVQHKQKMVFYTLRIVPRRLASRFGLR